MSSPKHDHDTEKRLLESACRVFAEKGYGDATIAEICEHAGANIAAVNYYFRNKATLYVEAWRHAFARSAERHPHDGGVPVDAPAAERLRGQVLAIMQRIGDPECYEFEIIHKEMANPSGLLGDAMNEAIEPVRLTFQSIVRELVGEAAPESVVGLCIASIRSQCFGPMLHERHRKKTPQGDAKLPLPPRLDVSLEDYAEHVVTFSLAGLREMRRRVEDGELT